MDRAVGLLGKRYLESPEHRRGSSRRSVVTRMTDDEVIWKQWDPLSNVTETFVTGSTLTVEAQCACGLVYRKRYLI